MYCKLISFSSSLVSDEQLSSLAAVVPGDRPRGALRSPAAVLCRTEGSTPAVHVHQVLFLPTTNWLHELTVKCLVPRSVHHPNIPKVINCTYDLYAN